METKYSHMAGKKITIDGDIYYSNAYFFNGAEYGGIFKDEKAFKEDPKAVCYIPEHAFDDAEGIEVDGETYYDVTGYTREDLENLIEGETDEEGDPIDIEHFFYNLLWAYPETYLSEITYNKKESK